MYGYNAAGEAVAELTADNADLRWTVEVANKKAAWYQFQLALDIPEAAQAPATTLRNLTTVPAGERDRLAIRPGPRSIRGRERAGKPEYAFDTGTFLGHPVYLGELRTDEAGRLLFLGGRGVSASYPRSRRRTSPTTTAGTTTPATGRSPRRSASTEGASRSIRPGWWSLPRISHRSSRRCARCTT